MRGHQILPIDRIMDPVFQAKAGRQLDPCHDLEACQHSVFANFAAFGQAVTMRLIAWSEDRPGQDSTPERGIAKRLQPLLDVLNVFKHHHGTSLTNSDPTVQICGVFP